MVKKKRLLDEYQFPGFSPRSKIQGIFGDQRARIIRLKRTQKKRHVAIAEQFIGAIMTRRYEGYETCHVPTRVCI
jgi:hypothetical protein